MYRILLVDDEADIIEIVRYNLVAQGWQVESASNGVEALDVLKNYSPDLILLDVMMPQMDGITLCQTIRESLKSDVLIALLTARGEDYSQIAGFDAGADDYITKPIRPAVLVSRLKALLKRKSSIITPEMGITVDRLRYVAVVDGKEIALPKKEFQLLELLLSKPGRVFTREEIYDTIWGEDVIVGDRTIDVHIRKLREHVGQDCITTIKGVGYKIE